MRPWASAEESTKCIIHPLSKLRLANKRRSLSSATRPTTVTCAACAPTSAPGESLVACDSPLRAEADALEKSNRKGSHICFKINRRPDKSCHCSHYFYSTTWTADVH